MFSNGLYHRGQARFGSELYDTIYKDGIIQFRPKAGLAPVVCTIDLILEIDILVNSYKV